MPKNGRQYFFGWPIQNDLGKVFDSNWYIFFFSLEFSSKLSYIQNAIKAVQHLFNGWFRTARTLPKMMGA